MVGLLSSIDIADCVPQPVVVLIKRVVRDLVKRAIQGARSEGCFGELVAHADSRILSATFSGTRSRACNRSSEVRFHCR
jgi:hypothetical protein